MLGLLLRKQNQTHGLPRVENETRTGGLAIFA